MADISSITLPDNTTYNLKDVVARTRVLQSKEYTGVIGTANNWDNAVFFFGTILPTDYYDQWALEYRIRCEAAGRNDAKAYAEVELAGTQNSLRASKSWNSIANTSYRSAYYHELYLATSTGISNGYGHALGLRLQSSWNPTTVANARTVTIEITRCVNCTFTFFDSMTKYASIPGTGSTNYSSYSEYNFADNGLQETGDSNNYDRHLLNNEGSSYIAGSNKVYPYTLIFQKSDGTWESIVLSSSTSSGKSPNSNGFKPHSLLLYWGSTTKASEEALGNSIYQSKPDNDMRYSFNGVTTSASTTVLVANKAVYLVGTIVNRLFYLDETTWFSQDLPTSEDGKVYIYIGQVFDAYRATFHFEHPIYKYVDGEIRQLDFNNTEATFVNGHTVNVDVPSGAKFTDTTYSASTSKLVTTTIPNVTSVGSAPTLGTAIAADDITGWTTNTPTAFSVSGEKLSITTGTAAELSYTARSIPNVTSVGSAPTLGTAITVATGSLNSNASGASIVTGITAS